MKVNLKNYRKLLVATAGLLAEAIAEGGLSGNALYIAQGILAVLTLAGIRQVPAYDDAKLSR